MQYYRHNLSPFLIETDWLVLPWYWLVYLFGFVSVWFLARNCINKGFSTMPKRDFSDYMVVGWIAMLLGARAAYVLFYNFDLYAENFQRIFAIWEGGMSFHGGLLGLVIASTLLARRKRQSPFLFLDLLACTVPLALGLGRVANFINAELVGRPTDLPWAVIFPQFDELPRHPSQLYQALTEGFFLAFVLWLSRSKLRKQGALSSMFLIGYGALRLIVEFFREPDPQLGFIWLQITLGQIFCIAMIILGILLAYVRAAALKKAN